MNGKTTLIRMATIGAPHGVRGEVRVKTFTGDPLALGDYGLLKDGDGRAFAVLSIRPAKNVAVVRFEGVNTREAAEALNGTALYADRSALPDEALEEDEFFHADLIGLEAHTSEAGKIGTVSAVHDFGGGTILEIGLGGKKSVMVPFTKAAAPIVDMAGRRVVIDEAAAGLAEADGAGDGE